MHLNTLLKSFPKALVGLILVCGLVGCQNDRANNKIVEERGTKEVSIFSPEDYRFPREEGTTKEGYPVTLSGKPITKTPLVIKTDKSKVKDYPKHFIPGNESLSEDEMRITIMGSGTPAPIRAAQATSCVLVQLGNGNNFIFDIGSGTVGSLFSMGVHPSELDKVFITHLHLDHIGVHDGEINNGADDDGSGTVSILEIAEAFKIAADRGHGPKRSILFLHVTGEEKGLLGSKYYADVDPVFPLKNTVCNLNIDMIGRTDPKRESTNRNYLYLIGSDKLSTELHNISEEINSKYCNIEFDYKYNDDKDPNRFYYRSDHYNFAKNNIPVIFYFNGTHDDYHKPTDTSDKIDYDLLENRTRLIFHTAWEIANRENRIVVDKATN